MIVIKKIKTQKYNKVNIPDDPVNDNTYYTIYRDNDKVFTRTRTESDAIKIIILYQLTNIDTLYYKKFIGKKNIVSYKTHKERILKELFFKINEMEKKYTNINEPDNKMLESDKLDYYMKIVFNEDEKRKQFDKELQLSKNTEIKSIPPNKLI